MKKGGMTLNEIMGKHAGDAKGERKLKLADLDHVMGERMPKMEFTPIGRMRLKTALKNRFGKNYMNLPGISDVLKEFDDHASFQVKLMEMKMLKPRGGK